MHPQFPNYQAKQYYENKTYENPTRKPRPRQSEPPLIHPDIDPFSDIPPEQKTRKPRPSQIGFEATNKTSVNRGGNTINQFPSYQNMKKGMNLTKNQASKYKEDYISQKKGDMTLPNTSSREEQQQQGSSSTKMISSNRFLSPQLKVGGMVHHPNTERKYSQNFDDINFFKGHKASNPNLLSKQLVSGNNNNNSKNPNISSNQSNNQVSNQQQPLTQQKRTPRFSEPGNYTMQEDYDTTGTMYNQKVSQLAQDTTSKHAKNKQITGGLKSPKEYSSIQKKINPYILDKNKNIVSNTNNQQQTGGSAFKKIKQMKQMKQLKQTVSTHSTSDSKKLQLGGLQINSPIFKKDSKFQQKSQKPQQIKVTDFFRGKQMGSGKFGSVCIVKHKYTGFVCAMKSIPKAMIREENIINQLIRQLKIQTYLDHPNIIKLYGFFHDKDFIYLLLQLGSSGQLYKVIKQRQRLSQSGSAYVIKQVCQAIRYLHFFKIIHRDLKPQNIVIQSGTIKLCDFGWAVARGGELRSTFCGTPLYVSPEILKGQMYDEKIDLWAIGILTYQLLFGNIPFQINTEQQLIKIVKQDIVFPTNIKISNQAKDFILRILKKNPDQRLKIGQLLDHDFIKKSPDMAPELE